MSEIIDGFERFDLPSATLWYRDEDHYYAAHNEKTGKKGKRMTGVTTVTKVMDIDPSNLMKWSARTNCIGVAELFRMQGGGSWLDSGESIWEELNAWSLTYEDVREKAAGRGTNVHERVLQALAAGEHPDTSDLTEEEAGHARGVIAFWLDHTPQPTLIEQAVCDPEINVAGRLDLLCSIDSREGQGVIDLKTGYVGASAHVQAAGYCHLARVSGFDVPDDAWQLILQTSEEGSYKLIDGAATEEDFLDAVRIYRAAGRINGAQRKQMKAVLA